MPPLIGPAISADRPGLRYSAAVAAVLVTGGVRFALVPLTGTEAPLLPFLLAVLAAACLGGRGPALLATVLTPVLVTPLFAGWPDGTHALDYGGHVALFLIIGLITAQLVHSLQVSYRHQQELLAASQETEKRAIASEAQLRLIADAVPVLIAYVDREHRYRFINKLYEEWFDASPAKSRGRHAREILGETVYEASRPYIENALAGERVSFEADLPVQGAGVRHVEAHYIPDMEPEGVVRGYVALIADITERKQIEESLREREHLLKLIYNNSSDDLYLLQTEPGHPPRVLSVNEPFLKTTSLLREQVEGRPIDEVIGNADHLRAKCEELMQTKRSLVFDAVSEVPSGHRYSEVTLIPILTEEAITHILVAAKDVTEKRRAEEALRAADRRKDDFLAMLAHELRNPLSPIRTAAHVLSRDGLPANTVRQQADILQRQASQLARLVDDLLDVARITRGLIELKRAPVQLDSVIDAAIEIANPLVTVKRQTVSVTRSATPVWIEGDAVRLSQAIGNVLINAAKYSPDRLPIELIVEGREKEAVIRIIDHGIGIDAEVLPHVFELFMQADRSLDRSQGGLGVGLTIVKVLIEMHGGTVEASSPGIGHGSEFILRLPVCSATDSGAASLKAAITASRCRVLVVDDAVDAAESLALLLGLDGHEVRTAHDSVAALAVLETFDAQVILLDIGLPGTDGYVLAQSIRERFPRPNRRLYALTGYGTPEDRALALSAGFDDHLTKPVDPTMLLQMLARESAAAAPAAKP